MAQLHPSWHYQRCLRSTRRKLLVSGSAIAGALLSGCSDDPLTDQPDTNSDEDEESAESDTDQTDETDDYEQDQDNEREPPEDDQAMRVEDTSFEIVSIENGTGEQNAISEVDGEQVHIEGIIAGQNGCYTADLSDVLIEGTDLRVQVESYDDSNEDELCTEALVDIKYTADVLLSETPATVIIEHNDDEVTSG